MAEKIITDEEITEELKKDFPIDLLTEEEQQTAKNLAKFGYLHAVKYINAAHPDLGLKVSKTYYDLYIKK